MADEYVPGRYGVAMHGVGLCDEAPAIYYPQDYEEVGYDGVFRFFRILQFRQRLRLREHRSALTMALKNLRFLNPVQSGSQVRGRFVLADAVERKPDQWLLSYDVTGEIRMITTIGIRYVSSELTAVNDSFSKNTSNLFVKAPSGLQRGPASFRDAP